MQEETLTFLRKKCSSWEATPTGRFLTRQSVDFRTNAFFFSNLPSSLKNIKILLTQTLYIKTGWIRAPRSRFGPREKHEKHPD